MAGMTLEAHIVNLIFTLREMRTLVNRLIQWTEDDGTFTVADLPFIRALVIEISEKLGRPTEWRRLSTLYEIADDFIPDH